MWEESTTSERLNAGNRKYFLIGTGKVSRAKVLANIRAPKMRCPHPLSGELRMFLRPSFASASVAPEMDEPPQKLLRTVSFVVHATRGIIRDQNVRRKTMFILLVVALLLLFSGSTFLAATLNPRQHPGWFIFFWFVCAWLTLTAMFLAIFDVLMVRLQGRKAERSLSRKYSRPETPDWPSTRDGE